MKRKSRIPRPIFVNVVLTLVCLGTELVAQPPVPCYNVDVGFEDITVTSTLEGTVTVDVFAVLLTCTAPICVLPNRALITVTAAGQQQTQVVDPFTYIHFTAHVQTLFVFVGIPNGTYKAAIEITPMTGTLQCTAATRTFYRKFHVGPAVAIGPVD